MTVRRARRQAAAVAARSPATSTFISDRGRILGFLFLGARRPGCLRVARAWFELPDLQALLPFGEGERRWMRDAYREDCDRPETAFSRIDVATDLSRPNWKERLRFLEVNLCGIGATYFTSCAGQIAWEVFAPHLPFRTAPEDDEPSAVVARDYQMTVIQTKDGRVLSGVVSRDTDSSLTILTLNDALIVPRDDVEKLERSSSSMMPEDMLPSLPDGEVRDLFAYLASPSQVPLAREE